MDNFVVQVRAVDAPASGGGLSQNGKFSYGYASSPGKRASMEDFYETRIDGVDGEVVGLFGVFDGHGGARAAEYVKRNLFSNLISHPKFISDTKSAISDAYNHTDSEFLKSENNQNRDAGSTASTAILVGDRLLVANVGDSRAVICRGGDGDIKKNELNSFIRVSRISLGVGFYLVGVVVSCICACILSRPAFISHQGCHVDNKRTPSWCYTRRRYGKWKEANGFRDSLEGSRSFRNVLGCSTTNLGALESSWAFRYILAIAVSRDHKPDQTDERQRIEDAGGFVMWAGTWRVGGVLAVSRAFGDRLLKQYVVADPEIQEEKVDSSLEFLILASDGLWDVVTNEEAVAMVKPIEEPEEAAKMLMHEAFQRGSADNITTVVVRFLSNQTVSSLAVDSVKGPVAAAVSGLPKK